MCVWPINCYRLMPYLLICRARPKMLARLLLEQMRASLGWGWWSCRTAIHCGSWNTWKNGKIYVQYLFYNEDLAWLFLQRAAWPISIHRKRATSLQIQSCHHAQAIEVETYIICQSCIPVRHYRLVAFWRLYFRSNTPSWNPWKNIRTGHVAVDDFGRQQ